MLISYMQDRVQESPETIRTYYVNSMAIVIGGILAYFLLVAFCLSEPLQQGLVEEPTIEGKGQHGACTDYLLAPSARLAAKKINGQLILYQRPDF